MAGGKKRRDGGARGKPPVRPLGAGGARDRIGATPSPASGGGPLAPRTLWILLAVVLLGALVALLTVWRPKRDAGVSSEPLPPPRATTVAATVTSDHFVGSASCAECHARESAAWRASTHARAGGSPGEVQLIAPFDGTPIRFRDAEVIPRNAGGRPSFVVRQAGADDVVLPVDGVVGGGHMEGGGTQGFVTRNADGTLRFLPFDFSRHTGIWFCNTIGRGNNGWVPISPALPISACVDWPPVRVLGDEPRFSNCQSCHGSQIVVALDTARGGYRTRYASLGINCESCHGPARRHLALVRDTAAVRRGDVGLAPLATLDKDASLGTCWSCHALKDRLRGGYLSGMRLASYYSTLLPQLGDAAHRPDGRVRTFAYQQGHLWSDCYVNGGMTCTSCHDPHSQGYRDAAGVAIPGRLDDRQCTGCHASKADSASRHTHHAEGSKGSACVSCHLPYRQEPELGTAIRYARSDHAIPVPRPAHDAAMGVVSACRGCHADRNEQQLEAQVAAWYGEVKPLARAVQAQLRARTVDERAAAAKLVLVPGERHVAALFSGMAEFLERFLTPDMPSLERDVVVRLQGLAAHADADVRALALASLHFARGSDAGVRRFLAEALGSVDAAAEPELRGRWSLVLGYLGDRLRREGNPLAAIATYRKAQEVDPRNPQIPVNLALAYADAGNLASAVEAYRASLSLDPRQPLTLVNLGNALAERSEGAAAAEAYRRALALNPREPLAWFNLGALAARAGQADSAVAWFERAAELDPSIAQARFLAARMYLQRGDERGALRAIEAGLRVEPGNAEAAAMRDQLRARLP